jgi:hypothetical protein
LDKVQSEFERYKAKIEKENLKLLKKKSEKLAFNKSGSNLERNMNESEDCQENKTDIQLKSLKKEFDVVSNRLREKYEQQTRNIYVESMKIIKELKISSINAVKNIEFLNI